MILAHRDYYNVLGVTRKASQDEIKRAYRSLARRWHPDRNPGDQAVVQRFKDITEAYQALSDPERRARYDRLGPLYTPDGRPPRPDELHEMVGSVFDNFFRRRKRTKGEDLRYTISVTLEQVHTGLDKELVLPRLVRCATCRGDGADPEGGRTRCQVCDGRGRAKGARILRTRCYHCEGRGYAVVQTCPTCEGEGRRTIEDALRVKVPPGVSSGQRLRLVGKGQAPRGAGTEGDLFVVVNVLEHPIFRRRGEDIWAEIPLTVAEAALGAEIPVPTLDGQTAIRIPPGTPSGKVLRLGGRGLPRVGRPGRGDLHLQVSIELPEGLSSEQREALARWAEELPAGLHPRREAFERALRERSP